MNGFALDALRTVRFRAMLRTAAFLIGIAVAAPSLAEVPEPLRAWKEWALKDKPDHDCPYYYNDGDTRQCSWLSAVNLSLDKRGGSFDYRVLVHRTLWIPLPGGVEHWPQNVKSDGKPVAVTPRDDAPGVTLEPGTHTLSGAFLWDEMPESLPLPDELALVALTLDGKKIESPRRDTDGSLWLQKQTAREQGGDHLEIQVSRMLDDDIPFEVATRLEVTMSGKNREATLPNVLLPGLIPLKLDSGLPARVEPDGMLRLQLRPGRWTITLTARSMTPVSSLALPKRADALSEEEIWAFNAHNDLRVVDTQGGTPVDPRQTVLPDEWKSMPAFRIRPGEALKLAERKRGDPQPAPDDLRLERAIWLDFDGGGYTIRDGIGGSIRRSWRLSMAAPAMLGRAAIDGEAQFITTLGNEQGIEVRKGAVNIEADSRIDSPMRHLSATGWQQEFQHVSAQLNLPPGWSLFAATGADEVSGAWVSQWSLLDFFIVLIIAFSCGRLWGWRWGALALAAMALSYHQPGAPRWTWLAALAAIALLKVLPLQARASKVLRLCLRGAMLALVVILLPFVLAQVRQSLYPVLEDVTEMHPEMYTLAAPAVQKEVVPPPADAPVEAKILDQRAAPFVAPPELAVPTPPPKMASPSNGQALREDVENPYGLSSLLLNRVDPAAVVQTGPGLPHWNWHVYRLSWNGPVDGTQEIGLWLLSPAMNVALSILRIALLGLLFARLLDRPLPRLRLPGRAAAAVFIAIVAGGAVMPQEAKANGFPDKEILKQLEDELTKAPECLPACADVPRMQVSAKGGALSLRLEVHAETDAAIPLPGGPAQWLAQNVTVDGKAADGMRRDENDTIWLLVKAGTHQVLMQGSVAQAENINLSLPLKPRRVEAELDGWTIAGIGDSGKPDDNLQLSRVQKSAGDKSLHEAALPGFVRVERTLLLGLRWEVHTRVVRASPSNTPIFVAVPLLPGESLTGNEPRVEKGVAQVNLGPQTEEVQWVSALDMRPELRLRAAKQDSYVESWRLQAGTQWHVEHAGIPVIHHQDDEAQWSPEWRPWPGEEVTLKITKPAGVPGQILTLDNSTMEVSPGIRNSSVELVLVLRSSRGGQHVVRLPEGAVLQDVAIDARTLPVRLEGRELRLPLRPGRQEVTVRWHQPGGISTYFRTPEVDTGLASVNARVEIHLPSDRWTLLLGGPRMGPAILIWGVIITIALAAFAMRRVDVTPLRPRHWFLLGLGLTQVPLPVSALVVGWLFALASRCRYGERMGDRRFKAAQVLLALWTAAALIALAVAVSQSLIGHPDMHIAGNGSGPFDLHWYQDRSPSTLPQPWIVTVPMLLYRLLMLLWALWLAYALLRWLKWGWECFSAGGYWRAKVKAEEVAASAASD